MQIKCGFEDFFVNICFYISTYVIICSTISIKESRGILGMRSIKVLTAILLAFVFAVPVPALAVSSNSHKLSVIVHTTEYETTAPTTESTQPASKEVSPPLRNGFAKEENGVRYYICGIMQKGFVRINGYYYYFDSKGFMATGFRNLIGHRFYFASNGHMVTGLRKIGKYKYYFRINGWMVKGFVKIGKSKYYFNKNGRMVKGSRKIGKSYYYFLKNGKMKKGFLRKKGKLYYYSKINGKRVSGVYRIGKHIYCFKKKGGAAIKGFAHLKHKGKKILVYFNKKFRLQKGRFKIGRMEYKASKKTGKIYSFRNTAKALCQLPEMPSGCEITAWTMMANFAGVNISKKQAAKAMPRSNNPNKGFVGSPYKSSGGALVVYPNGLKKMTVKYLGSYNNLSGCSHKTIKNNSEKENSLWSGYTGSGLTGHIQSH